MGGEGEIAIATISRLSAVLTANISGFSAGMKQAQGEASGFASSFKATAGAVAGAAGIIGIAFSADAAIEYVKHTFDAIDANAKLSDSLGISTLALGKLQYAASYAGVANDELSGGIVKMLKNIAALDNGSKEATAAFNRLGISAADLKGKTPDEAFARIGEGLMKIEDPAQRAATTMEIFGKSGTKLLPLLAQSSDALAQQGAEAEKLGYALNRVDSAKVEIANDAITKLWNILQGAVNKLAVEMAPYIDALAAKLADVGMTGQGASGVLLAAFEGVVRGVAYAADYLSLLQAGWKYMQAAATDSIANTVAAIDALVHGVSYLWEKLGGTPIDTTFIDQFAQGLRQDADKLKEAGDKAYGDFSTGANAKAVGEFFAGIRAGAQKSAEEIARAAETTKGFGMEAEDSATGFEKASKVVDEIRSKIEEFGRSKGDVIALKIKASGGDEAQQAEGRHLQQQLEDMEQAKKAQDDLVKAAQQLEQETRTPLEKFGDQIDKINQMFAAGAIDLETYQRAIGKAEDDLAKTTKDKKTTLHIEVEQPQMLEAGSQAAAEFVAKFQQQGAQNERERQLAEEAKKQTAYQKQIARNLENTSVLKVVDWNSGGMLS